MDKLQNLISPFRIKHLRAQGYFNYSDAQISELAFGHRFAFVLCTTFLTIGTITANVPLLATMMAIAFSSVILPYHPFDYIYNHIIRKKLNKPELPKRSIQLKFACGFATVWIGGMIYCFTSGMTSAAYTMGGVLIGVATLVSTTDVCIPSLMFNFLFMKN